MLYAKFKLNVTIKHNFQHKYRKESPTHTVTEDVGATVGQPIKL